MKNRGTVYVRIAVYTGSVNCNQGMLIMEVDLLLVYQLILASLFLALFLINNMPKNGKDL